MIDAATTNIENKTKTTIIEAKNNLKSVNSIYKKKNERINKPTTVSNIILLRFSKTCGAKDLFHGNHP